MHMTSFLMLNIHLLQSEHTQYPLFLPSHSYEKLENNFFVKLMHLQLVSLVEQVLLCSITLYTEISNFQYLNYYHVLVSLWHSFISFKQQCNCPALSRETVRLWRI